MHHISRWISIALFTVACSESMPLPSPHAKPTQDHMQQSGADASSNVMCDPQKYHCALPDVDIQAACRSVSTQCKNFPWSKELYEKAKAYLAKSSGAGSDTKKLAAQKISQAAGETRQATSPTTRASKTCSPVFDTAILFNKPDGAKLSLTMSATDSCTLLEETTINGNRWCQVECSSTQAFAACDDVECK